MGVRYKYRTFLIKLKNRQLGFGRTIQFINIIVVSVFKEYIKRLKFC